MESEMTERLDSLTIYSLFHAVSSASTVSAASSRLQDSIQQRHTKAQSSIRLLNAETTSQQAAKGVVLLMEQRLHQQLKSETLLRPASEATPLNMLLCPASNPAQITSKETAQLLRPTAMPEEAEPTHQFAFPLAEQTAPEEAEQQLHLNSEPKE